MEQLNPKFAFYGSKNNCTRTDTVFSPLSEVSTGAVFSLILCKGAEAKELLSCFKGHFDVTILENLFIRVVKKTHC